MNSTCRSLETAISLGMSLPEAAQAMLSGSFGRPRSPRDLLSSVRDPYKVLMIARALLEDAGKAEEVLKALRSLKIHPMSLLLSDVGVSLESPWLQRVLPGFADPLECRYSSRENLVLIRRYSFSGSGPRSLRLILDPGIHSIHLADAFPGALFGTDSHLKTDLTIMACEGPISLPRKVDGFLKIAFSPASLRFNPERMVVRDRLEIRDVPLPFTLPKVVQARELILDRCPEVHELPTALPRLKILEILRTPIQSLPHHLPQLESLHLSGIQGLRRISIPAGLKVRLRLNDLPALESVILDPASSIERLEVCQCPKLYGLA